MSSDPISDDEQAEVDDGTLSEVIRRPTITAGDLSEVADASPGITTEDLARDLEAVASKPGIATERELLEELLQQVRGIGEHLGIATGSYDETPMAKEQMDALIDGMWPRLQEAVAEAIKNAPEVRRMVAEISELRERMHRIELNSRSSQVSRDTDSEPTRPVPPGAKSTPIDPTLPTPLPESSR